MHIIETIGRRHKKYVTTMTEPRFESGTTVSNYYPNRVDVIDNSPKISQSETFVTYERDIGYFLVD